MKRVALPCGETVPALGQGTWHMGEDPSLRAPEIDALRHGIDLGLTLIDTAEMYGDGASESLVGEAIQGRGDQGLSAQRLAGGQGIDVHDSRMLLLNFLALGSVAVE